MTLAGGKHHLIPSFQPAGDGGYVSARRKNSTLAGTQAAPTSVKRGVQRGQILTQHTGLPPRETGGASTRAAAPARRPPKARSGRS
jgi:Domain of unknown function (DUF3362)